MTDRQERRLQWRFHEDIRLTLTMAFAYLFVGVLLLSILLGNSLRMVAVIVNSPNTVIEVQAIAPTNREYTP